MHPVKISRSCDQCKERKVRCTKANEADQICVHCRRRGSACHFSAYKMRQRRQRTAALSEPPYSDSPKHLSDTNPASPSGPRNPIGSPPPSVFQSRRKLFMDYLLEDRRMAGRQAHHSLFKANDHYVASSNLAFFSGKRLSSLSRILGHERVRSIVESIESTVRGKIAADDTNSSFDPSHPPQVLLHEKMSLQQVYVESYFEHIHPVYTFLDRKAFEQQAFGPRSDSLLDNDPGWSALYYAVLALGCQYHGEGSFTPGKGKAWNFFQAAVWHLPKILVPQRSLVNAQALTAMTIFTLNPVGLHMNEFLMTEAVQAVRALGLHRADSSHCNNEDARRTFWVIYCLEKHLTFDDGKASSIADFDIGCPIPKCPNARFGKLDWPLTSVQLARLLTITYETLFSVSATLRSAEEYYEAIDFIQERLEQWRASLPEEFQPGNPLKASSKSIPGYVQVFLQIQFSYYNLLIVLSRLVIHVGHGDNSERQTKSLDVLLSSARSIIELTMLVDPEPYTPIWMIGTVPLAALFILFDFVVHNPTHPSNTQVNLKFLDMVAGHLSCVDLASHGAFPSALLAEFTHIARQHVQNAAEKQQQQQQQQSGAVEEQALLSVAPRIGQTRQETAPDIHAMELETSAQTVGRMEVPESLGFGYDFLPMQPQNMGFDLMGLFGPFMNAGPLLQQSEFFQQEQHGFNAIGRSE